MLAIRAYLLVDFQVNAGGYARFISPGSWDATAEYLFLASGISVVVGAILGVFGLRRARRSGGASRRLAVVAMWLNGVLVVFYIVAFVVLVLIIVSWPEDY